MRSASSAVTDRGSMGVIQARPNAPSPLVSDQHEPFPVPMTDVECDAVLAQATSRLKYLPESAREELLTDLARFLGASSRVWTAERRQALRSLLARNDVAGVGAALMAAEKTPREEVVDEAVSVLALSVENDPAMVATFVEVLMPTPPGMSLTEPLAREIVLRALVKAHCPGARESKLKVAFAMAKSDPVPAVREVAVQALSTIGQRAGADMILVYLRSLRAIEADPQVCESIDEAIAVVESR